MADYNPDNNFAFNSDSFQIGGGNNTYQESPLFIFYNDSYVNIAQYKLTGSQLNNVGDDNFNLEPTNSLIRLITTGDNDTVNKNLRIIAFRKPVKAETVNIYSENYDI